MRIWIDLANSPHPPLFGPIVRRLEERGHEIVLTAREHAQTVALARQLWPSVEVIGGPSPAGRSAKARAIVGRVHALRTWARRQMVDAALSHNSYAQIMAARSLRLPTVTAMDYEHQRINHLAFRLADQVLVPEVFPEEALRRFGASAEKVHRYPGLKEHIYLGDFVPDPEILKTVGLSTPLAGPLIVTRTPPTGALYHRHENSLYIDVLEEVLSTPGVRCVVLPRSPEQREELVSALPGALVPSTAVDARSLIYVADIVIGAGGTMTREAALLGVPTVSLFSGRPAAADDWLQAHGCLTRIWSVDQLPTLVKSDSTRTTTAQLQTEGDVAINRFVEAVEKLS